MNNKKRKMLLLSLVIVLVMGVGATIAYIHMNTQSVANTFEPTQVSCEVDETFDNKTKTDVKIKNIGTIDAFIRAEVVITWKKQIGNEYVVYGKRPVEGVDYTIEYDFTGGWTEEMADGFFYYKYAVAEDASSNVLIKECVAAKGNAPDGYYLSVEIIGSAIQADGESFGEPTGTAGHKPAEIAWSNDKVEISVNDAATQLTVNNK